MIQGVFVENIPFIKIVVAWERSTQNPIVVLDTGFTGDLQVTPKLAKELGLKIAGATKTRIASGEIIDVPIAPAVASMEGVNKNIQVLISESIPLVGIGFLSKFEYKAIVDCKYRKVALEKMV